MTYEESWKRTPPSWRLEVRPQIAAMYAGTLSAPRTGRGVKGAGRSHFFDRDRFEVRDESAEAREIHGKWMIGIEPLTTHLVSSQSPSEPLIIETPPGW